MRFAILYSIFSTVWSLVPHANPLQGGFPGTPPGVETKRIHVEIAGVA